MLDESLAISGKVPGAAGAWYYKGLAYRMLQQKDDAIIALEESLRLAESAQTRRLLESIASGGN